MAERTDAEVLAKVLDEYLQALAGAVESHRGERGGLISILEEIQAKYSYLPEEALRLANKSLTQKTEQLEALVLTASRLQ